jgi:hypothetical protein
MFKLVMMIFAVHGADLEPMQAFRLHEPFATEAVCKTYLTSKEGKEQQRKIQNDLSEVKGVKLKAKFSCVKIEEEKTDGDDGKI